ncbi:uncharacterized protein LOC118191160 [Stegodyphus dumicola]|uniref:uncharacterized protein LOC118191160 n=1 Tax=Stegodyphus dumicola TaxID=202533 RepID=UPI0015B0B15B|nr:uncharacterized protein LOC118191160 [Stegodyphus dumicola]
MFEDFCCCCGMLLKLDKNNKKVQEDLLSVTPQCFKLTDSPKSKVNMVICNNNSFPVYFKLYSSNVHAIRFRPMEGCIPSDEQISVTVVQKSPKKEGITVTVSPSPRTENSQLHARRQDTHSKTKRQCENNNSQQDTSNKFKEHNRCHYCKLKQCHIQHEALKKSCLCDVRNDCFEEVNKTWKEGHSSKDIAPLGRKDELQGSKTCKCCTVSKVSPHGGIKTHTRMKHKSIEESSSEDEPSGLKSTRFISYPNQKIENEKETEKKKSDSEESSISTTPTPAKQHSRAKRNSNNRKKFNRETIGKRVEILCENIQRTVRSNFCIQMLILLIIVIIVVSGIGCGRRTGWSFPCFYDFFRRY